MTITETPLTAHLRALASEHPGPVGGALLAAAEQAERQQGELALLRAVAEAAWQKAVDELNGVVVAEQALRDALKARESHP